MVDLHLSDNTARIASWEVEASVVNLHQVIFEVTDACNLNCKYCIYGDIYSGYDHRSSQYMSFADAKGVIDYLVDVWKSHPVLTERNETVISFYGGEPLLNFPLVQQIVDYVEHLDVPRVFSFAMTSNCMLLDRYMDYLVEKNVNLLCSLDGDRMMDGYRVDHNGNPSFDRVFANIKALQEKYPDYFDLNVSFNSVLHSLNTVQSAVEFIKKEFGKVPLINEISDRGVRPEQRETFNKTYRNAYESLHQAENYEDLVGEISHANYDQNEATIFLDSSSGNVFKKYKDLLSEVEQDRNFPSGTCIPFNRKMFVKVDGKILPCEQIHHVFAMGYVRDGVVHLDFDEVTNKFNRHLDMIQGRCSACFKKNNCTQCLYQIDGIEDGKPKCREFLERQGYEQYVKRCHDYLYDHPTVLRDFLQKSLY